MKQKAMLISATMLSAMWGAENAKAQETSTVSTPPQEQPRPDSNGSLGDIVVTANRVSSTAQRTPLALSAYSKSDLASAGVSSVQALQRIDPSVNVSFQTGEAYVAIRGIASTDLTEIGDPSVPIARDGFFMNRSYAIGTSFYDIDHVEVLKGPQGTLFGRNSTGGLVNIITKRPSDAYEGYASLEVGDYNTVNAEAAVNIPLSDRIQIRLSGINRYDTGYRHVIGVNERGDDDNTTSGRFQIAAQPIDGLNLLVTYQHDRVDNVGDLSALTPIAEDPVALDPKRFENFQPTFNRLTGNRVRWEAVYDRLPGGLTLTYSGGRDQESWHHGLDYTTADAADGQRQFLQNEHPVTWNNEVRLNNNPDNPLSFQVGYFGFKEQNSLFSQLLVTTGPFSGRNLLTFPYEVSSISNSAFGQLGLKVFDDLKLTAGVRYNWDRKTRAGDALLDLQVATNGAVPPQTIVTPGNGAISERKPTFHGGIEWTPRAANLIYAKFDTGYKAGGFNSNGSQPSIDYGPESVETAELGSKNKLFGGHVLANADIFYTYYRGYQAAQTTPIISSGSGVFNVGDAHIYGAEAQIAYQSNGTRFQLDATYLHAKFGNHIGLIQSGSGDNIDISGNRLPNAPDLVASASLEHAFDLGRGTLTPRVQAKYSSSFFYSAFNYPDIRQRSYAMVDLSLQYALPGGRYAVEVFARNVTDKAVLAGSQRNYTTNFNNYEFQPPRTVGVRLSGTFR